ncbi:MAG: alpha/beta hydrolase, partial [Nanoarchaeota archaeon]
EKAIPPPGDTIENAGTSVTFRGVSAPFRASLAAPTEAVLQPANPTVSIVGSPMELRTIDVPPDVMITLTVRVPANLSVEGLTLNLAQWYNGSWHVLDAARDGPTMSVTARWESGGSVFALLAGECTTCGKAALRQHYSAPGAQDMIVFVHGLFSDQASFLPLIREISFTKQQVALYTFTYPFNQSLELSAVQLANAIEEAHTQYKRITIVGHSAGGIVTQLALRHAMFAREKDSGTFAMLPKLHKVVLEGAPNEGILPGMTLVSTAQTLVNTHTATPVLSVDNRVVRDVVDPPRIQRIPGIDYVVLAGARNYEGAATGSDGVVSIESARQVGDAPLATMCEDYLELPLTHTAIVDDELAMRTLLRVLLDAQGTPGHEQHVQIRVTSCDASDTYVVLGKRMPAQKAPQPLQCGCGNGFCGLDETRQSCPIDCANILTLENAISASPWVEGGLLALTALAILFGPLLSVLVARRPLRAPVRATAALLFMTGALDIGAFAIVGATHIVTFALIAIEAAILAVLLRAGRSLPLDKYDVVGHEQFMVRPTIQDVREKVRMLMRAPRRLAAREIKEHKDIRSAERTLRAIEATESKAEQSDMQDVRTRLEAIRRKLRRQKR